ncbi:MAG: class I SAM-dependent methyltransferase [Candidatus Omnitrophica bacterium]|nr:class I SAM-dependent methyltransferase [Candidatus Omnitrophota bacterium]
MGDVQDKGLFDEYCDSIFKQSNDLSSEVFESTAENIGRALQGVLPRDKAARILDVGCGCGHFLHYMKRKGYVDVSGIDVSPQQVDHCVNTVGVKAYLADAQKYLEDKTEYYDFISMMSMLEHLPKNNVVPTLKSVHASLKDKGTLVVVVPNMASIIAPTLRYRDFTHECGFTETSLNQVLWLAGFRKIDVLSMPPKTAHSTWKQVLRTPMQKTLHAFMGIIYRCEGYYPPKVLTPGLKAVAIKGKG